MILLLLLIGAGFGVLFSFENTIIGVCFTSFLIFIVPLVIAWGAHYLYSRFDDSIYESVKEKLKYLATGGIIILIGSLFGSILYNLFNVVAVVVK